MTKKVCRKCKIFTDEPECPICHGTDFTESWKGRVIILKPEQSIIAKKLKLDKEGAFAIKIG